MKKVEVLLGPGRAGQVEQGPIHVHDAYRTVRHGSSDCIAAGEGEWLLCVRSGSPLGYGAWLRGPDLDVLRITDLAREEL